MGFRVQGFGFRVWGLGYEVTDFEAVTLRATPKKVFMLGTDEFRKISD